MNLGYSYRFNVFVLELMVVSCWRDGWPSSRSFWYETRKITIKKLKKFSVEEQLSLLFASDSEDEYIDSGSDYEPDDENYSSDENDSEVDGKFSSFSFSHNVRNTDNRYWKFILRAIRTYF